MPNNFTNNVTTHLRQGLLTTDTTMRVKLGDGAKFALPIGDYAYVTLRDKLNYEVVRYQIAGTIPTLPAPNPPVSPGDDITIIRAQDGTIARQFPVGTCVTIEWNEAQVNDTVNQIAELHETQVIGVAPIESVLDDTGIGKVYTVSINGSAFQVTQGIVDPTVAPAPSTPPFYINTVTNDAFVWTGTAWLLLTPNLRTGAVDPVSPPAIGESPFYLNTVTGLTFGWTSGGAWVQLTNPNTTPDLSAYATIVAMNLGDSTVQTAAANNLASAVAALNVSIAAAGVLQNVTATAPLASSGGANPNISHDVSGVVPGSYKDVTVSSLGHVLSGTPVGGSGTVLGGRVSVVVPNANIITASPGLSVSRSGAGVYVVTHNLGTTDYSVTASPDEDEIAMAIPTILPNSFTVRSTISSDAVATTTDTSFKFLILVI